MHVFVAGASGYLGGNLVLALTRGSFVTRITCLGRNQEKLLKLRALVAPQTKVVCIVGDVCDPGTYISYLRGVDVVVHAAAVRGIDYCAQHPHEAQRVNVAGTERLLEAAMACNVPKLLYCSTQAVYGAFNLYPFREDESPYPDTWYGLTKYAGELAVRKADGLQFLVLRLSRIYGLGIFFREEELPHRFARCAVSGILPVYHGGEDVVDLLHIGDAVSAILFFLHSADSLWNTTYNVGGGRPVSVRYLAELYREVCRELGFPVPEIHNFPAPQARKPKILGLDITRVRKTGWQPLCTLEEGIRELLLWYGKRAEGAQAPAETQKGL